MADALPAQRKAIAIDPGNASFQFNLGRLLHRAGDAAGAEAALREALALDPESVDASIALAYLLADEVRLDEMQAEATRAAAAMRELLAAARDAAP